MKDKSYVREQRQEGSAGLRRKVEPSTGPVAAPRSPVVPSLSGLPAEPAARSLRQAAAIQMQQQRGNTYLMRQVEDAPAESTTAPPSGTAEQAPASPGTAPEAGTPTEIVGDGGVVRVSGGGVEIRGGMVTVDAGITRMSGVMQADTVIANSVVGSSYTPGAGNLM